MKMKPKSVLKGKAAYWGFLVFSLAFFGIGSGVLWTNYTFMKNAEEIVGTVIYVREINDDDGTSYKPTVRFIVDGKAYEAESWMSSSGYDFRIGEEIPVLYDVSNPSRIRLNYFMEKWGFGAIFAGIGGTMFIRSLVVFIRRKPDRATGGRQRSEVVTARNYDSVASEREERDVPIQPSQNPTVRRR